MYLAKRCERAEAGVARTKRKHPGLCGSFACGVVRSTITHMDSARDMLNSFSLETLPDLDVAVAGALELFADPATELPSLPKNTYARPLVVGSGNAEATGRLMFEREDAVFASESNYAQKLSQIIDIDGVYLISASGGKHAPYIAQRARMLGKPVTLITANPDAPARAFVDPDHVFVYPKNREPYTYNTSTYLGMLLSRTHEDPTTILAYLKEHIETLELPGLSAYDKFFLIVPPHLAGITRMLTVKFIELFGRRIARDVETSEYMKHAVTVVPGGELFMSFGVENRVWGEPGNRVEVPLPEHAGYGMMLAVGYTLIGKIQRAHPPYFKDNLLTYTQAASEAFNESILPIVE